MTSGFADEAKAAFLRLMAKSGFVTEADSPRGLGVPGYNQFPVRFDDEPRWSVVDQRTERLGAKRFSGTMTLLHHDGSLIVPVWTMQYRGFATEAAAPIMREALLGAYRNKIFHGGRGEEVYRPTASSPLYTNQVSSKEPIDQFWSCTGVEQVHFTICSDDFGFRKVSTKLLEYQNTLAAFQPEARVEYACFLLV